MPLGSAPSRLGGLCAGIALALACLLAGAAGAQDVPARGLTGGAAIATAYDAIFDARFEEVPQLLAEACPPAPLEACRLLEALALWWRIQLDPFDRSRDAAYAERVEGAIAAADAWTRREPQRAEAWFYLGGAYGARVQMRVLRGARLAAARDGARIKAALERALALDPALADAWFGIGLYQYYAAVAPPALRVVGRLLLLPGGDRAGGLERMHRARRDGLLVRDEADYQLHLVYLWYEKQPARALALLDGLAARHPHNPHFQQAAADALDYYIDDTAESLRRWRALLAAAEQHRVAEHAIAETVARLGIAAQLDQLSDFDAALAALQVVIDRAPGAPVGALARAHLQRGDVLARLGRRAESDEAYRAAIAHAGDGDPAGIAARARGARRARR